MRPFYAVLGALVVAAASVYVTSAQQGPLPTTPILFVTQVPTPADFATIGAVFANHKGAVTDAPRGGDLWIRYPDGVLKNLTAAAGYGTTGLQGAGAIAVREPSVHWDGAKAVFSMVVGSPTRQYEVATYYWQLYEITGLGQNQTPVITKVPNQPANYNNVSPIYGADDRIIFSSDRPRDGQRHLYPQFDEYESTPVVTGLWSLDPATGDLFMLNHSPSGVFSPQVDSFGRVIFTRWDHLQRDQQADADAVNNTYGTFNYASEAPDAAALNSRVEVYPEPRRATGNVEAYTINHFFPWQINDDGTGEETLNHIGRHELHRYFNRSFNDDSRLQEFNPGSRFNPNSITNFLQIKEAPFQPGTYIGIDAPEFGTHAAGQIIGINGAPTVNPDQMAITYVTHPDTASTDDTPSANHSGLYRNPLPMADGLLVAVHTSETRADRNDGTRALPQSRYAFRIKTITQAGQYWLPSQPLTTGIVESVSYWDPDVLVSYTGELWELDPVEVRARPRPPQRTTEIQAPEQQVFAAEGIDVAELRRYLRANNLALVVSRDVTTRDGADRQQPFRLRVPGGGAESLPGTGTIYDIQFMQFFQADLIRGMGGPVNPRPGRRVLAQPMHDPAVHNPPLQTPLPGAVKLGLDGSMAAFVPARRALSWQLTSPAGAPVVRERYWLTLQPGEIRTCTSCHGINTSDQLNRPEPQNRPQALAELMRFYRAQAPGLGAPTNLQVQSVVGSTVTLQWVAGTGEAAPIGYLLEGGTTPGSAAGQVPTGSTSTTFSLALPSGVFYVRVKAQGPGGQVSGASNEVQVSVNVAGPLTAPTKLTGNAVGSRLQLAWTNGTGTAPTGILLNVTGALTLTVPLPPSETFSYPSVPPGTYTFSVLAQNGVGTSAASNSVTLTFPGACTPPGVPTNLQATRAGNLVTVWWESPASGGAPDGYTLNVTGSLVGSVSTAARSVSGVVGPGSYTIAAASINPCGTSAATPPQTMVVP